MRNLVGLWRRAGACAVVVSMTLANWSVNLIGLSLLTDEPFRQTVRAAFSRAFVAAFLYFSLAAILIANVMDGSPRGYLLAAVVGLLSVTLTETLVERRSRTRTVARRRRLGPAVARLAVARGAVARRID